MNYVETSVKKISGNPYGGYGIVFCLQDKDNFYTLIIDTEGWYVVYKLVDDEWILVHGGEEENGFWIHTDK